MLTLLTIIIICGVLIALQFPIVMSSPIAALGFAVLITVSLGSVSAKVGTTLAPLPIFALILVSEIRTWRFCSRVIYTPFNSNQQRSLNTERDYAQNGKCQNLFGCISLLFFLKSKKGVHTMLPISWPVSVVLAAILSIIHFGFRIVLNSDNFPELFIQTVSKINRMQFPNNMRFSLLSWCVHFYIADSWGAISRYGQCIWFILSNNVGCSAQSNGRWYTNWYSTTC